MRWRVLFDGARLVPSAWLPVLSRSDLLAGFRPVADESEWIEGKGCGSPQQRRGCERASSPRACCADSARSLRRLRGFGSSPRTDSVPSRPAHESQTFFAEAIYCTFTALSRKCLRMRRAGEGNRTLVIIRGTNCPAAFSLEVQSSGKIHHFTPLVRCLVNILDLVTDRLVAPHTFGIHCRKNRHTAIHVIINDDFALAVVKPVEATNVLL